MKRRLRIASAIATLAGGGVGAVIGGLTVVDIRGAFAVALLVTLVALVHLPIEATLALIVVAYALPLVWVTPAGLPDTRLLAPVLLLPLAMRSLKDDTPLWMNGVGGGMAVLCAASSISYLWSIRPAETVGAAAALASVAAFVILVARQLSAPRLVRFLRVAGACMVLSSVLLAAVPQGYLSGRLRGIFINPNSLATMLVLVIPFMLVGFWRIFGVASLVIVVLTASRAGTVACLLEIAVLLAMRGTFAVRRRVLVGGVAAAALAIGVSGGFSSPGIWAEATDNTTVMRLNDSRSSQWIAAFEAWLSDPIFGSGAGATPVEAASSYLKLLADLGVLGVVAVVPLLIALVRALPGHPEIVALAAGAAGNAIFEGWLFTAGSVFFLLFWLVVSCGGPRNEGHLPGRVSHAAAGASP